MASSHRRRCERYIKLVVVVAGLGLVPKAVIETEEEETAVAARAVVETEEMAREEEEREAAPPADRRGVGTSS